MSLLQVEVRSYGPPQVVREEVLRYMGCRIPNAEIETLLAEALDETQALLTPRVCFARVPVGHTEIGVDLGSVHTDSRALSKTLEGCGEAFVFAATVGLSLDRLLLRYGRLSPARALCVDAIGTAAVEAVCDRLCSELGASVQDAGRTVGRRFSPGYADLPLEVQSEIFSMLDCPRRIGLTLGAGLLMSPSKSVTAIVGIHSSGEKKGA